MCSIAPRDSSTAIGRGSPTREGGCPAASSSNGSCAAATDRRASGGRWPTSTPSGSRWPTTPASTPDMRTASGSAEDSSVVPLTTSVVLAAVCLRILLYLRDPSVWHDEAALLVNITGKSFSALLGPLDFAEAAPPLFMWIERAIALGLGGETLLLRLPALFAGCATLFVLMPVARRTLPPAVVPLALVVLAFSAKLIAHSVEAKPYAVDVLCSAVSVWLFLRSREWAPLKTLLTFSVVAPFLLWLSYPAAFVMGGTIVALAADMRADRNYRVALAAGLLVAATGGAFAL